MDQTQEAQGFEQAWRLGALRPWLRRLAFAAGFLAVVQPVIWSARSSAIWMRPVSREQVELARARVDQARLALEEAQQPTGLARRPTGSDVALARWCLRQGTPTCTWEDREITRLEAEIVMSALELGGTFFPERASGSIAHEEWVLEQALVARERVDERMGAQRVAWLAALRSGLMHALLLVALALGAAFAWWRSKVPFEVRVRQHEVTLGARRVPMAEVFACEVDGDALVLRIAGRRSQRTSPLDATPALLREIAERIDALAPSADERKDHLRARLALESHRAKLLERV